MSSTSEVDSAKYYWTKLSIEKQEAILDLKKSGLSGRKIAKIVGLAKSTVADFIRFKMGEQRVFKLNNNNEANGNGADGSIDLENSIIRGGREYVYIEDHDLIRHYYWAKDWSGTRGYPDVHMHGRGPRSYVLKEMVHQLLEYEPKRCPACQNFGPVHYHRDDSEEAEKECHWCNPDRRSDHD